MRILPFARAGTYGALHTRSYALAVVLCLIAALIRSLLTGVLGQQAPLLIFILPIVISAWYGGFGPSLAATVISGVIGGWLFLPPFGTFSIVGTANQMQMLLFLVEGTLISVLSNLFHHANHVAAKNEQHFHLLVDGVTDYAIYMLDPAGHVTSWNRGAARIMGYQADEIIGQHFTRFYSSEDVASGKPAHALATALAEGRYADEGWQTQLGGTRFWASVAITPLWENGQLQGFAHVTHDQTVRRESEAALRRSEVRLAGIIGSAMDAIIAVDANQRIVTWNAAAERMFGYSSAEAINQPLDRFIPERYRERHSTHVSAFSTTGVTTRAMGYLQPLAALRADGTEFPIEASISRVVADEETFYTVILRDISERAQAQAKLIASEARFAKLFQSSPVPTVISRVNDGLIIDVNESHLKFTGYDRSRLIGFRTSDLQMWVDPGERTRLITTLQRDGHVRDLEVQTRVAGGKVRNVLVATDPIELDGETLLLTTFVDITARKQAEVALRDQARLLDLASDAIIVHQGHTGGITFWNAGAATLYGWSQEEAIGQRPDVLLQTDFPVSRTTTEAVLAEQGEWEGELTQTAKDGRKVIVHSQWVAPRYGEPLAGMVLQINRDITERKQLEAQLIQAQKMESIGQLAGGIAHDFNNLLTAITGYTTLLEATLPDDPAVQADLKEIQQASQRAATLTRQLLTFARRQPMATDVVHLEHLLRNLDGLLRRLIGENITLVTISAPDLWTVWGDAGQIEQIVVNLAINARDAMPKGGTLTIETANVMIDADYARMHIDIVSGPYVMLAVSDTGTGMSPEVQRHIFEPFFTTKEPGKGTGLGLSTCYGIVKQHGGAIEVYSEVGHGTTFKMYLPSAPTATAGQIPDPGHNTRMLVGTETILLVEDESAVRALAARVLHNLGYTVLEATDGQDALRVAEVYTGKIDLLLTDVVMPRMGGPEAASILRAAQPELSVAFLSGYPRQAAQQRDQLGDNVILQKPFTPTTLAEAVRHALDGTHEHGHY
jgi:PAS domain S-box-containing protein